MKIKIKKGDTVTIITGDDKGKNGEVLAVFPKQNKLIVKDCNVVKKSMKPTEENKKGGFVAKEMPIHVSNVKKA